MGVFGSLSWLGQELKQREISSAERFVQSFASSLKAQYFERYSDSQALALNPYLIDAVEGNKEALFHGGRVVEEFIRLYQVYSAVIVSDSQGRAVIQRSLDPSFDIEAFLEREFQKQHFGTEEDLIGHRETSANHLTEFQYFRSPIRNFQGKIIGWVHDIASTLYVDRELSRAVGESLWHSKVPWSLELVDSEGQVLALLKDRSITYYPAADTKLDPNFLLAQFEHVMADERLENSLSWRARLSIPLKDLHANSNRLQWILWTINAILIVGGGLSIFFIQRSRERQKRKVIELVLSAQEQEKSRISREIHDEVGQTLSAAKIWLAKVKAQSTPETARSIDYVQSLIEATNDSLRSISLSLHPSFVKNLGLRDSVEWRLKTMCEGAGVLWNFQNDVGERLDYLEATMRMHIYRFLQEALHNVVKHSRAQKVYVQFFSEKNHVVVQVLDTGLGIQRLRKSIGFFSMEERAQALSGTLECISPLPSGLKQKYGLKLDTVGTCILLRIPNSLFTAQEAPNGRNQEVAHR